MNGLTNLLQKMIANVYTGALKLNSCVLHQRIAETKHYENILCFFSFF